MSTTKSNYSLEIISHHSKFNEKALRKYYVDGIETVGAWGDEPFEIRFKNNSWQKVQVKLSLDGTDILTGKPADTEASSNMWVVNGYETLSLKAWPETNNGGASFVFTSADNSVALHTHGDMSCRGIIAAAVFVEGHVEPVRICNPPIVIEHHHYKRRAVEYVPIIAPNTNPLIPYYGSIDVIYSNNTFNTSGTYNTSDSVLIGDTCYSGTVSFNASMSDGPSAASTESLKSLVSVGAGEHVDQKITYVTGLVKPVFSETIRVKYVWWDDLVDKLRTETKAQPQPSGFPGDKQKNIDLGKTPRIGNIKRSVAERPQTQVFERF